MQPESIGQDTVHILNGDALLERFPAAILGQRIVLRECLCEGPVHGKGLTEFFRTRAAYIAKRYPNWSATNYYRQSADEIRKIATIPSAISKVLWFEDDLFCQVNLWFAAHLMMHTGHTGRVFLVRPGGDHPYSFGELDDSGLVNAYWDKMEIHAGVFSDLWRHYQEDDMPAMLRIAEDQANKYPFLLPAIRAHHDRFPNSGSEGRPQRVLREILEEIGNADFSTIYRAFKEREAVYGYGDLQVRFLLREMGWIEPCN